MRQKKALFTQLGAWSSEHFGPFVLRAIYLAAGFAVREGKSDAPDGQRGCGRWPIIARVFRTQAPRLRSAGPRCKSVAAAGSGFVAAAPA